ncbi:hypothetical protein Barb4_01790 [Bacteroidales bacterium Barb4]|nr:hypothetical protein Barb4_01790 [Bacteroidales bacterium Barb4]
MGLKIYTSKEVLKERYKLQAIINNILHRLFGRPFRTILTVSSVNPTFRCAPCGAEFSCPFRAFA